MAQLTKWKQLSRSEKQEVSAHILDFIDNSIFYDAEQPPFHQFSNWVGWLRKETAEAKELLPYLTNDELRLLMEDLSTLRPSQISF